MATALWGEEGEENKEKIRQKSKKWRKKNPEATKAIQKKWRKKNLEYIKEYAKKRYKENPEPAKEYAKKRYKENPEYIKEYMKKRYKKNSEATKAIQERWRERSKEKKMLVIYYNSCCFNYTYRIQVLSKILEQYKLIMERLKIFKKHKKWNELVDIFKELPNLYIEHIVYFYYDYYCKYYTTADIQKLHLELMIVLAKKQNILFPENLIYETFEEQQSLVFYILFQMHEKYCKAIEDGEDFIEILDKAGFEKRFILEPFDFEKRE